MGLKDKAKAAAKNVEGKAQELKGEITADPKDKAAGKGKQAEANVRQSAEDVKDGARKALD